MKESTLHKNNLTIITVITIGLWIPVLIFGSSLIDNGFLCNQFYDNDKANNLNRCLNGESQFAFIVLTIFFTAFSLSATRKVLSTYSENKQWEKDHK